MKLALDPQMSYGTSSVYELPDVVASLGFDGVVSSCVFGWDEIARDVSLRQRDKALALVAKHFGSAAESALLSSKTIAAASDSSHG